MNPINQEYLQMYKQPQLLMVAEAFENMVSYEELIGNIPTVTHPEDTIKLFLETSKYISAKYRLEIARSRATSRYLSVEAKINVECFHDFDKLRHLMTDLIKLNQLAEFNQTKDFQELAGLIEPSLEILESSSSPLKYIVEIFGFFLLYNNIIWGKIFRSTRDQRRLQIFSLLIRSSLCSISRPK
jgi:hypothetical protein